MQSLFTVILLTIVIGCTVGYIGYAAFGSGIKAIILYNLPNQNGWAIAAKIFFIITTCGSFVLVI
jgi:amino acid permease